MSISNYNCINSLEIKLLLHYSTYKYGSFSLDPEDIKNQSLGANWKFSKENRAILTWYQINGHKGPV